MYHILSAEQLQQWDESEQEFYSGDITYKVRTLIALYAYSEYAIDYKKAY